MIPNDCNRFEQLRKSIKRGANRAAEARKVRPQSSKLNIEAKTLFDQVEQDTEKVYWKTRSLAGICNNLQSFYHHEFAMPQGITLKEIDYFCHLSGREYSSLFGANSDILR